MIFIDYFGLKESWVNSKTRVLIVIMLLLLCCTALWGESLGERTAAALKAKGISPWLIVILISMLPLIELRGSIPVAIALLGMPWQEAVILSIIGNMIPIPLILLFIQWFFSLISRFRWGRRFTEWISRRTVNKGKVVERYEEFGLVLFVGIPLPGTGGWTGSLAAKLFGLPFWKSLLWIFIGILLATAIVTSITLLGTSIL